MHAIERAYRAHKHIQTHLYVHGKLKKGHHPSKTAPALVQAMGYLGPQRLTLRDAQRRAVTAVNEPTVSQYLKGLDWGGLQQFLATIALFLKATREENVGGKKQPKVMQPFEDKSQQRLTPEERGRQALALARKIEQGKTNRNKMKRLSAHLANTGDKWTALAVLARYYPLKDVPAPAIDGMVKALSTLELHSFQELVAQAVIFYEASIKGWEGLKNE